MCKGRWWVINSVWLLFTMILVFYPPVAVVTVQFKRSDLVPLANLGSFVTFIFLLSAIISHSQIRLAQGLSRKKKLEFATRSGFTGLFSFLEMSVFMIPVGCGLSFVALSSSGFVFDTLLDFPPNENIISGFVIILPLVVAASITGRAMGGSIHEEHMKLLGSERIGEPSSYLIAYTVAGLAYILLWIAERAMQSTITESGNFLYAFLLNLIFLIAASQAIAASLSHFLYPVVQRISELDTQVANSTETATTETPDNVKE